jgi:glycosyltransferase involved in cell wall biosynthesis
MVERRVVLRSCCLHFATEDEAAQARWWIGDHPTAIIPVAVETPFLADPSRAAAWRMSIGVPTEVPLVGFLGRIHPVKGLDLLVDALAEVTGAHLIIAGPDDGKTQASLRHRASALGVAQRIHWPGLLDPTVRGAMLSAIDLFVLPSHSENFGLAAAEAMAADIPVIVTPGVNLASVIADSGAGHVVARDARKLAEILSTLLADKSKSSAMGAAGRRLVEERFSPQAVARQMLQLYEECLRRR